MTRPSRHAPHLVASAGRRRFLATATGVGVVAGLAPTRARAAALDATAMLGWVDPDAITVWVQSATDAEAVVSVIPDAPGLGSKVARVSLEAAAGRTGAVRLTGLEPSTRYRWTAVFDGRDPRGGGPEAIEGHFRTPPIWVPGTDPGPVTLAFGSCHYLND
ncbi:MAG: fibronectin type III domain-containing protein, partial [Burkholderiales bacterium]|nr:fibronectin type III domain-containing protein [Burkholderiales bacterium]